MSMERHQKVSCVSSRVATVAVFAILVATTECSTRDEGVQSQASTLVADAGELANAKAFIDSAFYADADIRHSFHTAVGEQIDCIDFYAQRSVKGFQAAGLAVIDPSHVPPPPPRLPPSTQQPRIQV